MDLPDSTIAVTGTGTFTEEAFSCNWSVDVLGQTSDNDVKGSPAVVWLGDQPLPAVSAEAQRAQWLCPSSPLFWAGFGELPEGGDSDVKNDVPSRRVDMTQNAEGIPGMQFEEVTGITLEQAFLWVADPGDWVAAIELVMSVAPDAATQIWGVPFDPAADATRMVYTIDVTRPDDPGLGVTLPTPVDFSVGYGNVTVEGDPLPGFETGGLDPA
ncbi:MAG: hypothetical protein JRE18_07640, partial [Deltaproteobacteria bacterium]|nr:hypothetical protein [Deltaproteobacteria bacterium]